MNIGFILAGGTGQRFGASIPKQYMSLNGKLVIQYAIDSLYNAKIVDKIVVVANDEKIPGLNHVDQVIKGGSTRFDSVLNALNYCPEDINIVVFQDAVRPFTPIKHYQKCFNMLNELPTLEYIVTAQKITDGLFQGKNQYIEQGIDRSEYRHCQTPEMARLVSLKPLYKQCAIEAYDEVQKINYICQLYDILGNVGSYVELEHPNLKITYDYDLFTAEQLTKYAKPDKSPNQILTNKTILIIGANGDIGKALKVHLECLGALVYTPSRDLLNIKNLKDLTLDSLENKYDCVINCAGIYAKDEENYFTNLKSIMKTNFSGVIKLVDVCRKYWLQGGGNLILLGSASASYGRKGISAYSASKAALNTFVESVKDKLLEEKIKVNVICPAKVKGKLQKTLNPNANQEEMIDPMDLAKIIANYVTTEDTGQIVYVRNGQENE